MAKTVKRSASLKELNAKPLFGVLLLNAAIYYLVERSLAVTMSGLLALTSGWVTAWPAGLGFALIGVLNGQISSDAKAKLVFWRWHSPYPGCRAFTEYGPKDAAVDMTLLQQRYGTLPASPKEQNVLWYRMYRRIADLPPVSEAHRQFLFARDYTFVALLILIVFGGAAALEVRPLSTFLIYLLLLILQWLLATNAANIAGRRFVTVVLAQEATRR